MDLGDIFEYLEPITSENIHLLKEGDWIWDNDAVVRKEHGRKWRAEDIAERVGFRQIHILDLCLYPHWSSKPFMLSSIDEGYYEWTYFQQGRFFMFKKKEDAELVRNRE